MIYAVYDRATKKIAKQGIAATADDCALQIENPQTQDVVSADDSDALADEIAAKGLHQ